ncbi:MAG: hypothetical protein Q7R41_19830 [Phycisphaerales bacterium]|jgi:hypothetical protein|nr:hypothetical protein [Phycisphaerales bacterium]
MKTRRARKVLAIGMFAAFCSVFGTGCSIDGLLKNVWFGFGAGLGGIPAQIAGDFLLNVFGLGTGENVPA